MRKTTCSTVHDKKLVGIYTVKLHNTPSIYINSGYDIEAFNPPCSSMCFRKFTGQLKVLDICNMDYWFPLLYFEV